MTMADLKWLDYSGESIDQLLSLEGEYRIDSLVVACEQAIWQKVAREEESSLSDPEGIVLAIEGLEREVNNGGYQQFLLNTPVFAPIIVHSLARIGCTKTAEITQKALDVLRLPKLAPKTIEAVMAEDKPERDEELDRCDRLYYEAGEDISGRLFEFIKANRSVFKS